MKLSSTEMFGRGRREAQGEKARADEARANEATVDGATAARPTFTPAEDDDVADAPTPVRGEVVSDTPVTRTTRMAYDRPTAVDEPGYNEPAGQPVGYAADAPVGTGTVTDGGQPTEGSVPAPRQATRMADRPASALNAGPMADLDQPLFSDAEFASQWQRVQAGFVDNPRVAVSEAADLVEQAGQALADALRKRQTRLRELWDSNGANGTGRGGAAAATVGGAADTEELRLMMRRYRGLFDQLSHL
jgi:hypothetical protein